MRGAGPGLSTPKAALRPAFGMGPDHETLRTGVTFLEAQPKKYLRRVLTGGNTDSGELGQTLGSEAASCTAPLRGLPNAHPQQPTPGLPPSSWEARGRGAGREHVTRMPIAAGSGEGAYPPERTAPRERGPRAVSAA